MKTNQASTSYTRYWLVLALLILAIPAFAESARLTINNNSERDLTVKVMKNSGGLYTTLYIGPKQSRTCYIQQQGYYYTKVKAERNRFDTIYSKDDAFYVTNNSTGYSVLELTYWIEESQYPQSSGTRISKSQFESDDK